MPFPRTPDASLTSRLWLGAWVVAFAASGLTATYYLVVAPWRALPPSVIAAAEQACASAKSCLAVQPSWRGQRESGLQVHAALEIQLKGKPAERSAAIDAVKAAIASSTSPIAITTRIDREESKK
jgi:hypothetical protein